MTDTAQQKNALAWYQDTYQKLGLERYEVTVTGHSKGGNKSKYITLMDDSVSQMRFFRWTGLF
ncbi:MAG: DUF2974 domain-containing protein [Oscillibacter sp.]|nr:DUF2974 domain-containing protein [Oscillibacter sp.]